MGGGFRLMLGNIDFIINKVVKKHGFQKEILEEIYYSYWEEVRRKLFYSEYPAIYLSQIGTLAISNNSVRRTARKLLKEIRRYKKALNEIPKDDPKYKACEQRMEKLKLQFKACWSQMEIYRKVIPINGRRVEKWKKYYNEQV